MPTSQQLVKDILERIKKIRVEKGYSQEYMADMLSISQNAYHKLERGHTRINLQKFIDISKILEIEISELINGVVIASAKTQSVDGHIYMSFGEADVGGAGIDRQYCTDRSVAQVFAGFAVDTQQSVIGFAG